MIFEFLSDNRLCMSHQTVLIYQTQQLINTKTAVQEPGRQETEAE